MALVADGTLVFMGLPLQMIDSLFGTFYVGLGMRMIFLGL